MEKIEYLPLGSVVLLEGGIKKLIIVGRRLTVKMGEKANFFDYAGAQFPEYALNTEHPVGGNKAKVFDSALGYNQTNVDDLIQQVYSKLPDNEAVLGKLDAYGQRYTVDMPIMGPNGNTVNVRTGWIIKTDSSIPEVTTIYVKN